MVKIVWSVIISAKLIRFSQSTFAHADGRDENRLAVDTVKVELKKEKKNFKYDKREKNIR